MTGMYVARLICSDVQCAAELTAEAAEALELETLLCACGCTLEIIGWPDWVDEPGEVVMLRTRSARALRSAA
jgi:hypothetical protein